MTDKANTTEQPIDFDIKENREALMSRPISDLRMVEIHWEPVPKEDGEGFYYTPANKHIILVEHLERFLTAFIRLHHTPGVNNAIVKRNKDMGYAPGHPDYDDPHTARIASMTFAPLVPQEPAWWTSPGLGDNGDNVGVNGSVTFDLDIIKSKKWNSPEEEKRIQEYHDMEDEYENRNVTPESIKAFFDMLQPAVERGVEVTIIANQ